MTTYNVLDNRRHIVGTYPRYMPFDRYRAMTASVTWIPLLIGGNRVRFFAESTLEEVAVHVPNMTDMLFTCAEPPPLQGCELPPPIQGCELPPLKTLEIVVTPDMIGKEGKPGTKAIPGINLAECANVTITVVEPAPVQVTLFHESMVEQKAA